ncbi:MAG: Gfo/Idh/MocA family protein, partial [Actinomycetota bacterium]
LAEARGSRGAIADPPELLADSGAHALVVCSPNAIHTADALAAVAAGVHVLVEKPVTVTLEECEALAVRASAQSVTVGVGHMWRHRAEVIALRDRIAAGDVGRVVRTHGWGVHAGWGPSGWFTDPVLAGGGALIDMGIHAIDTARFLIGDPEPVRVTASIGFGEFSDTVVDDDGVDVIEWDNGVRSVVEFGCWQPVLGGLEADTRIHGTGGSAQIWPDFASYGPDYQHCSVEMYAEQIRDFVDACRAGRDPIGSLAVGRTALAIVRDAYAAAR